MPNINKLSKITNPILKAIQTKMGVLTILFSFFILVATILYFVIKRNHNYWKTRNVPHIKPTFFFGNCVKWMLQKEFIGTTMQRLCEKFPCEPYFGAYIGTEPVLIVQDPETIKLILTKEFSHFNSRELMNFIHKETFRRSVIFTHGEDWRFTRTNMAPMFSISKLKSMFPLIEECAVDFEKYLDTEIKGKSVEARELLSSYMMAVLVSFAFGIDLKNFGKASAFRTMGKMIFEIDMLKGIMMRIRALWPSIFYGLGLRQLPSSMPIFFKQLLKEVFEARGFKPSARNDFIDGLLHLKEAAEKQYGLIDDDYITAQSLGIFAAGFEPPSFTLSYLLYEIAKHKDVQGKVHKEIDEYLQKTDGKITYDCLTELPYLSACMHETMRLYPILGVLTREVTKDYTMPSGLVLERGLRINFPQHQMHRNPEYFPNPDEFRPERFYGETKQDIVPYSFLPFGEGPRICLGKRFAMLQSLPGLVTILRNHKVQLAEGMPTTIEFEPKSLFTTMAKGGIHLKFLCRN